MVILWQCQKCRSWLRDDRLVELVVDVVCSELLDPLRASPLERQLRAAFRSRQKASLKGRTQLERRLSELHEEKLAKLDGLLHGIDPALISEAIDRLSENESRVRDELSRMTRELHEQNLLTSVSRLRQAGPELSAALLSGPEELRRRILSRLVKTVTYLKENRNIEVTLVLPIQMWLSGSRLPMIWPRREGPRSASQIDSARGGAPTESTRVEGGFELLIPVPWTKSRTQAPRS